MRILAFVLLSFSILLSGRVLAQDLPETEFIRYEYMDYTTYEGQDGWVLQSRIVPHYSGGVLDTVFINRNNGDLTFSPYRRIRYTPFSLFPEVAITEELNGNTWITIRTDSFAYISGIRTTKISHLLQGSNLDSTVRSKYEYNGEGKISARTDEALVGASWKLLKKVAYLYDDAYHVLGLEDSTLKGGKFIQTGRELRDYVDGALDEITREVGEHPNFSGVEKFRYWFTKKWNPAFSYTAQKETFFDTLVGANQTRSLVISNPNNEPVIVAGLKIKSGKFFKLRDAVLTSYAIPANSELRVPIVFSPKLRGTYVDSVSVTVNGGVNTTSALVGLAKSGILGLKPSVLDFGSVPLGDTATRTLLLTNEGDVPLTIDSIVSLNSPFIAYSLTAQIKPMVGLDLPMRFTPPTLGLHNGSFRIYYHDDAGPRDTLVLARGTGAGVIDRRGILALDLIDLNFGKICIGDTLRLTVALSNIGDTLIHLDTAISSFAAFETSVFPIKTLAPTEHTSVDVAFIPTAVGAFEATIVIIYGDPDLMLDTTITVTGVAVTKPVESVDARIEESIAIYPNPAAERVMINGDDHRIISGYFVLANGSIRSIEANELLAGQISTSALPAGSATLILKTSEGTISKKLLIVR